MAPTGGIHREYIGLFLFTAACVLLTFIMYDEARAPADTEGARQEETRRAPVGPVAPPWKALGIKAGTAAIGSAALASALSLVAGGSEAWVPVVPWTITYLVLLGLDAREEWRKGDRGRTETLLVVPYIIVAATEFVFLALRNSGLAAAFAVLETVLISVLYPMRRRSLPTVPRRPPSV